TVVLRARLWLLAGEAVVAVVVAERRIAPLAFASTVAPVRERHDHRRQRGEINHASCGCGFHDQNLTRSAAMMRVSLLTRSGRHPAGEGVVVYPSGDVTPPCPAKYGSADCRWLNSRS